MVSNPNAPLPSTASPILKPFLIGLGCQKQITAQQILLSLYEVLQNHQAYIHTLAIPAFKYNNKNIQDLQQKLTNPIHYISRYTLLTLQSKCQSFSSKVFTLTGLGAISEACLLAIMHEKDHLLIPKMIYKGITLSLAYKGAS